MPLFHRTMMMSVLSAATLFAAGVASAGTIRDDRADSDYTSLASTSPYNAVGYFQTRSVINPQTPIQGSGTLISNRWVLTAAHVNTSAANQSFILNGIEYEIAQVIRDPLWNGSTGIQNGQDLMLIKLTAPVAGVIPVALTNGDQSNLLGQVATYTGYGTTGTGLTGAPTSQTGAGTARAGNNTLDKAGETFNFGNGPVTYANNVIFADFDNPNAPITYNTYGSSTALNLEYLPAFLDSGGGVFVNKNGTQTLAGVNSTVIIRNIDGSAGNPFEYGDLIGATMVTTADRLWINNAIFGGLSPGDYDASGAVGQGDLALVLQFWGAAVADGQSPDASWINPIHVTGPLIGQDELALVLQNWGNTQSLLAQLEGISSVTGLSEDQLRELVPEPGTLALLALGAGGMLMRRRRGNV